MKSSVFWIDGPGPGRLAIVPRPRGGDWLQDEVASWHQAKIDVVISTLTPDEIGDLKLLEEDNLAREQGLEYRVFPISDRGVPATFEKLEAFARELEADLALGKNIAIHCRQGIGRSALVAACVLIVGGLEPKEALDRVKAARGCSVPETSEQRDWVFAFAKTVSAVAKR